VSPANNALGTSAASPVERPISQIVCNDDMYGPTDPEVIDALKRIGAGVRAARYDHALSQMQLERLSGVDQTTISRLENGRAPRLRLDVLARIAMALSGSRLLGLEPPDTERRPWP
jgi:DNA-binding Xre family transcriptional regulator